MLAGLQARRIALMVGEDRPVPGRTGSGYGILVSCCWLQGAGDWILVTFIDIENIEYPI